MRQTINTGLFGLILFTLFACEAINKAPLDLEEKPPLLSSDGSIFVAKDYYPTFSWERTPQYFMFWDPEVLAPEEVAFIAERTDFICIEKAHAREDLGYAELGAKHEVAAFKAVNPEIKSLFYFNSAYAWPFTSYNQYFTRDKIEDHPELKKLLLHNKETGELEHRNNVFFFDVLNPELRKWWVETVSKGVEASNSDGVFIDQMHGFVWLRSDQKEEVESAMGEMMANLKAAIGPDKILLGNNSARVDQVFPSIDANMFEHYNTKLMSKENLLLEWEDMLKIAKAGKISIFRIGVETEAKELENKESIDLEQLSQERLPYYLACYLIGAQPYSYFQYGWGWKLSTGAQVNYPDLMKPLGAPKAAYKRIRPDGWEFTREFEHASVWLDTEKGESKITWK